MGTSASNIIKEGLIYTGIKPIKKIEIDELYSYESSMCKIQFEIKNDDEKKKFGFATGFFCEIRDENIPFKKALFTNNHVLNIKSIEIGEVIIFEHLKKIKKIEITENRRVFTNTDLDYTCIEIIDSDKINNFFKIDKTLFENKNSLLNQEIFILQYSLGEDLSFYPGKIMDINENIIRHSACTEKGSSGSPLIKRYNNIFIYGIHFAQEKNIINPFKYNLATPFDVIIRDIKDKLNYENNNNIISKINNQKEEKIYNEIIITLEISKDDINKKIQFLDNSDYTDYKGQHHVDNLKELNETNAKIFINGKENKYSKYFVPLEKGIYEIKLIFFIKMKKCSYMFKCCSNIRTINFSNFNTSNVTDMSYMFDGCTYYFTLPDISKWNTINVTNMRGMFYSCSRTLALPDISKWNTHNVTDMSYMFYYCEELSTLPDISKWDTSNVINMNFMFSGCKKLLSLPDSSYWNTSNVTKMNDMFYKCYILSNLPDISKWDTSKVTDMSKMFFWCGFSNLPDISKWDTSKVIDMSEMFFLCSNLSSLPDISNWDTSNVTNMNSMFANCFNLSSLPDISKWDTNNVTDMNGIFFNCPKNLVIPTKFK